MSIIINNRQIAIPGDLIAEGNFRPGDGVYQEGKQIFASQIGLVTIQGNRISLIALLGPYIPRQDDYVIGKIIDASMNSWKVDINAPYVALLTLSNAVPRSFDPTREKALSYYNIGDTILARIISQDRIMGPMLTVMERNLGKLKQGRLIEVVAAKIPRLVGRRRSMINMIETESNTRIEIGQNGVVWINGENEADELLAENAAKMVEKEAHTTGLTDRVREMLTVEKKKESQ